MVNFNDKRVIYPLVLCRSRIEPGSVKASSFVIKIIVLIVHQVWSLSGKEARKEPRKE